MISVFLIASTLAVHAPADPVGYYGQPSPADSSNPTRIRIEGAPRIGDSSFALKLERAQPGGSGFLLLSQSAGSTNLEGLEFLVGIGDPSTLCFGPFEVDANGDATMPLPLDPIEGLIGATVFVQWVSTNSASPSGLEASRGLRVTVRGDNAGTLVASPEGLSLVRENGEISFAPLPPRSITTLSVSADGRRALITRQENLTGSTSALVIDTEDLTTQQTLTFPAEEPVLTAAFHPLTNEVFALVGDPATTGPFSIQVLSLEPSGAVLSRSFEVTTGLLLSGNMTFSPNGESLHLPFRLLEVLVDTDPASPTRDASRFVDSAFSFFEPGGRQYASVPFPGSLMEFRSTADGTISDTLTLPEEFFLIRAFASPSRALFAIPIAGQFEILVVPRENSETPLFVAPSFGTFMRFSFDDSRLIVAGQLIDDAKVRLTVTSLDSPSTPTVILLPKLSNVSAFDLL